MTISAIWFCDLHEDTLTSHPDNLGSQEGTNRLSDFRMWTLTLAIVFVLSSTTYVGLLGIYRGLRNP